VNVEPLTLKRLAEIDNIVGVKEASGNISQMAAVIHQVPGAVRGSFGRRLRSRFR
jgi:4-hydroxy-tetrahydrodipicolinate synthase